MTTDIIQTEAATTIPANTNTPVPANLNPAQLLSQAIASGATPDILERLMDAQERWESRQARKEFDAAMAKARQQIPNIHKTKKGHGYSYEGLDDIARTIRPILAEHGLSYRWKTDQDASTIKVTCIIAHASGHTEENSMAAPINAVATKLQNPIQAMGSAITYLQRYTLKAALGLSASLDDDAASLTAAPINDDQRDHLLSLLQEHDIDIERFCTAYGISNVAALKASDYQRALTAINRRIAQIKQQQEQQEQQEAVSGREQGMQDKQHEEAAYA